MSQSKLRLLDLFSGIGGFSLGLERTGGFKTVAFCEIEEFPRRVLAKHWPGVPIFYNVRTVAYDGPVDVIAGGYPCQPFSGAGKRKGADDDRHLWPAMFSLIKKHRPTWVIGENVAGHISLGLDAVLADLASEDYACRPFVIPACAVNAPHRRDRVWIIANSAGHGWEQGLAHSGGFLEGTPPREEFGFGDGGKTLANAPGSGLEGKQRTLVERSRIRLANSSQWETEPAVGRVVAGIPNRVDRLKALGNAVVPQIPELIGNAILQSMRAA